MAEDCELCGAKGEEFRLLYKSDLAFCIVNLEALKPGHVMVLPTRHVTNFSELTAEESKAIFQVMEKARQRIKEVYVDPLILINTGKHCSQEHLHLHMIPSKNHTRDIFSELENLPKREEKDKKTLKEYRDALL